MGRRWTGHTSVMQCVSVLYDCVCVCVWVCWGFRHGRNNRPRSGKHQAEAFSFFLGVLDREDWALWVAFSALPRNLKHKPPACRQPRELLHTSSAFAFFFFFFNLYRGQDGCVLTNQNKYLLQGIHYFLHSSGIDQKVVVLGPDHPAHPGDLKLTALAHL